MSPERHTLFFLDSFGLDLISIVGAFLSGKPSTLNKAIDENSVVKMNIHGENSIVGS